MPKKHSQKHYPTKPASTVPSSLSLRPRQDESSSSSSSTVNSLLSSLRRTQAHVSAIPSQFLFPSPATLPSLPPSITQVLEIPDLPPPRPRPGMRVRDPDGPNIRRRRAPAGPAAPESWATATFTPESMQNPYQGDVIGQLEGSAVPTHLGYDANSSHYTNIYPTNNKQFEFIFNEKTMAPLETEITTPRVRLSPELPHVPRPNSLQHACLKKLAETFSFQVSYQRYNLSPLLRPALKELLCAYVATYGDGMTLRGLKTLFANNAEIEGGTGGEGIKCLDLRGSIENGLKLDDLKEFLGGDRTNSIDDELGDGGPMSPSSSATPPPSSWSDAGDDDSVAGDLSYRFPSLKTLSLALRPPSLSHEPPSLPSSSWYSLLSLAPTIQTLSYLSLAHWPKPWDAQVTFRNVLKVMYCLKGLDVAVWEGWATKADDVGAMVRGWESMRGMRNTNHMVKGLLDGWTKKVDEIEAWQDYRAKEDLLTGR
ncbi:MAG: hypothetical protein M1834_002773 [Cirrosporium novae-zelandiae]|nr:MAG: hypothetical protein M1834_002773 [Cirrosporium novae-zelandiae]